MSDITFVNDHRFIAKVKQQSDVFRFDTAFAPQADKLFRLAIPGDVQTIFHKLTVSNLNGSSLDAMTRSCVHHLYKIMHSSYSSTEWQILDKKTFVEHLVLGAAARAVIGDFDDQIHSEKVRQEFAAFDDYLNYVMVAPEFMLKNIRKHQDYVKDYTRQLL